VAGDFCYWERLSAPDTELDSILANNIVSDGPVVADILAGDVAFNSSGCGEWVPYTPPPTQLTSFGSGVFVVGSDIPAGTYAGEGGEDCYWHRLSGFSADFGELIDIQNMTEPGRVVIEPTDVGFQSDGCGTWTLLTRAG
jgi:hypothetical protein